MFCAVGFTCFTLCFVLIHVFHFVLCCWILVFHIVFCAVGFTCFTLCFVLLDSRVSLYVLCCWIYVFYFAFCVVGPRVSLCFALLILVFRFVFCAAGYTCFNCNFPAIMEKAVTNHCLARQPLTNLPHRIQHSVTATAVSGVALVRWRSDTSNKLDSPTVATFSPESLSTGPAQYTVAAKGELFTESVCFRRPTGYVALVALYVPHMSRGMLHLLADVITVLHSGSPECLHCVVWTFTNIGTLVYANRLFICLFVSSNLR